MMGLHEVEATTTLPDEIASGLGIGLAAAARLLPVDGSGRATHPASLTRWIAHGTRGASGQLVRLEAVRIGRKLVTTPAAIRRFLVRLAAEDDRPLLPAPPTGRRAEEMRREEEAQLRALGL